ncbi:MAG TPA: hypothetical protein VGK00_05665 [Anaerolineales bacterium]|jgi:tetratricopeptide (TPR) repeat protein
MTNEIDPNELSETQPNNLSETRPNNVPETQSDDLSETQPKSIGEVPQDDPGSTQPHGINDTQPNKKARSSFSGFWISLLILLAALGLGSLAGYGRGVNERVSAQSTLVADQLGAQFALVQDDMNSGRYDVARKRLEYIIQQNANYPGAAEKLADVLVKQAITPSPVPTDTPTITPTPDLRSQEAIFTQAQQQNDAKDWTALMGSLDSLRKADPTYKAVLVDDMYYAALRNRGVDQILGIGKYTTSNMEGGIYDLTLAERFGPLDGYADGLRNFSRMYIIGASFWDVNWPQAVNYFRQVVQFAPNLRDSSNVTASQRLYQALLKYGDQLASNPKVKDRCTALDIWNEANNLSALNNEYAYKYNQLNLDCNPPTEVPTVAPVELTAPPAPTDAGVPPTVEPPTVTPTPTPG